MILAIKLQQNYDLDRVATSIVSLIKCDKIKENTITGVGVTAGKHKQYILNLKLTEGDQ